MSDLLTPKRRKARYKFKKARSTITICFYSIMADHEVSYRSESSIWKQLCEK